MKKLLVFFKKCLLNSLSPECYVTCRKIYKSVKLFYLLILFRPIEASPFREVRQGGDTEKEIQPLEFIEQINLSEIKYVSFDIFDTLLARPFLSPSDLFHYMEEIYKEKNFAFMRIEAEKIARGKIDGEVTIDEIYANMPGKLKHFQKIEEDIEKKCLRATKKGMELFNLALQHKKKIVLISDMYLPCKLILSVLDREGFTDISKIYLSSDVKKTKSKGDLYEYVLSDLEINPNEIIHIGDNFSSDIEKARSYGINARIIRTSPEFNKDPLVSWAYRRYQANNALLNSVNVTLLNEYKEKSSAGFLNLLGFILAGPLVYSYLLFIYSKLENKGEALLFIARDGYLLEKAHKIMMPQIPSYYIYASRQLYMGCSLNYSNNESRLKVLLGNFFRDTGIKEKVSESFEKNQALFRKYYTQLLSWKEINLKNYQIYLERKNIKQNNLISVDLTTESFSVSNLFYKIFGERYKKAFFTYTYGKDQHLAMYSFSNKKKLQQHEESVIFFSEFLLSAPELSVTGITEGGIPRFDVNSIKNEEYVEIERGALTYIQMLINRLGCITPYSSFENWIKDVESFFRYIDRDSLTQLGNYNIDNLGLFDNLAEAVLLWKKRFTNIS